MGVSIFSAYGQRFDHQWKARTYKCMAVWQQPLSLLNNNADGALIDKFKLVVNHDGHPLKGETD